VVEEPDDGEHGKKLGSENLQWQSMEAFKFIYF
jgi:hypothetical protein